MADDGHVKDRQVRISVPVAILWAGILIALAITVSGLFPRYSAVAGERMMVVDHWTGRVCVFATSSASGYRCEPLGAVTSP